MHTYYTQEHMAREVGSAATNPDRMEPWQVAWSPYVRRTAPPCAWCVLRSPRAEQVRNAAGSRRTESCNVGATCGPVASLPWPTRATCRVQTLAALAGSGEVVELGSKVEGSTQDVLRPTPGAERYGSALGATPSAPRTTYEVRRSLGIRLPQSGRRTYGVAGNFAPGASATGRSSSTR